MFRIHFLPGKSEQGDPETQKLNGLTTRNIKRNNFPLGGARRNGVTNEPEIDPRTTGGSIFLVRNGYVIKAGSEAL